MLITFIDFLDNIRRIRPLNFYGIKQPSHMTYWKPLPFLSFLLILLLSQTACEKFSGDQTIPAFLSIDSIYLTTDYSLQGSASQSITDAWVYVDDDFIGTFELPARFPVLKKGNHKVRILPGIKKNGIASTRINYEFYEEISENIIPGKDSVPFGEDSTTRLGVLKSTYTSSTGFTWKEDFESISISLDTTSRSIAFIQITPSGSQKTFEGMHSGMVVLDTTRDFFECQTHNEFTIPYAPVFLEMNFNTSNLLTIGLILYSTTNIYTVPIINLNKTNNIWKKIYVDLTTSMNAYPNVFSYRLYMGTFKDKDSLQTTVLFDNLKLVTRK